MTTLDMRSLILSYAIVDIACLMVIVSFWWQTRKRFAGTIFFVFDFAFQASALFLIILRGQIPNWMSYILASSLVVGGALLGYMGLERFLERKRSQLHNYVLLIAFVFVHVYFTFVQPDQAARNLNASTGLLVICFQCAWLIFRKVKHNMRQLTRGVGIVFGLYCLLNMARVVEYFIGPHMTSDYLQSGTFDKVALIANEILFIFLTYRLALMFNKRLLSDMIKQEEKYSKAFHSSPYAVILDRLSDGRINEVNEGFLNMTGYQYADVRERTTMDLHFWSGEEDRAAVINELTMNGKVRTREFQFQTKSGKEIAGLLSADIITIDHEKYILSCVNDISELKRAEDALRLSEDKYRSIFENAVEGIYQTTPEGQYISVNPALVKMLGYESPEDLMMCVADVSRELFIGPEDMERYVMIIREKGIVEGFEAQLYREDGSAIWTSTNARAIKDSAGNIIRFEGTVEDITNRKQAEEEIRRLKTGLEQEIMERTKELRDSQLALLNLVDDLNQNSQGLASANLAIEAVNKELAAFSYSVSHDLRAPLRGIDGFSIALLEDCGDKLDEAGKKYLERIRLATQNMGRLIDDMLNLSRVTQSEFRQEWVDLSKMVHSIANEYQQNSPPNGMVVNIEEGIFIRGDQRLMHIAMTNLLENAWKFAGKQDHPHIEFGAIVKDGKTIIFVRDNGVGFDMNYAGKLFGAFQRLHRSDEFPGTGIGLATVQRIVNRHGGRVWAESEIEKGATFYFTIPG